MLTIGFPFDIVDVNEVEGIPHHNSQSYNIWLSIGASANRQRTFNRIDYVAIRFSCLLNVNNISLETYYHLMVAYLRMCVAGRGTERRPPNSIRAVSAIGCRENFLVRELFLNYLYENIVEHWVDIKHASVSGTIEVVTQRRKWNVTYCINVKSLRNFN